MLLLCRPHYGEANPGGAPVHVVVTDYLESLCSQILDKCFNGHKQKYYMFGVIFSLIFFVSRINGMCVSIKCVIGNNQSSLVQTITAIMVQ